MRERVASIKFGVHEDCGGWPSQCEECKHCMKQDDLPIEADKEEHRSTFLGY